MSKLDPRLTPARPDLAGAHLEGRVEAARFTEGTRHQVVRGVADLRRAPAEDATLDSQLLHGELVQVYETRDGWAWLQNETDGYVGYAPAAALSAETAAPSHAVRVLGSFVYPEPDLKAPPLDRLPMGAALAVGGERSGFRERAGGGWIYGRHLAGLAERAEDFVTTALEFLGAPYLWGGKTADGLDCSALVQIALHRAGRPCPRDSAHQEAALGTARPLDAPAERGDLIYFPDHVAIALDQWRVVNANAHDMLVAIEPLAELTARAKRVCGRGITAVRRLED